MHSERLHSASASEDVLTLRAIRPEDQAVLLQIFASTRDEERHLLDLSSQAWETFVRQQFDFQHAQYMSAYANPSFDLVLREGEVAGRLYVDRGADEIRVVDIALLPEHRRQGLGRQMLAALIQESNDRGIPLGLHVEKHNPVIDFYSRLGFSPLADRGVYVYMRRPCAAANSI